MLVDSIRIDRFQKALPTIRLVAGLSAEQLASMLDVSRITIVRLENMDAKMSVVQYLALYKLFESFIDETVQLWLVKTVINILVEIDDVSEEAKEAIFDEVKRVSKVYGRKIGCYKMSKILLETLPPFLIRALSSVGQSS